jgi:hypothetical protein
MIAAAAAAAAVFQIFQTKQNNYKSSSRIYEPYREFRGKG